MSLIKNNLRITPQKANINVFGGVFMGEKRIIALMCAILIFSSGICAGSIYKNNYSDSVVTSAQNDSVPLVTIMYHNFSKTVSKCDKYTITPETFENDILYLAENGYTFVNCSDIINHAKGNSTLPKKSALITIDDGYYNNYEYIFPLVKKHNIKIVISPIAIECDKYTQSMDLNPNYANMCWDNIKEMSKSGLVEIQNHTYNLHKLTKDAIGCNIATNEDDESYKKRIYEDFKTANEKIYSATGKMPQCIVYPFGSVNALAKDVTESLGLIMSLSCTEGVSTITRDEQSLRMIRRYNRPHGISTQDFFKGIIQ